MSDDVAILVLSCDNYSDLWEPCFKLFFKYWPDCPYPVYLAANKKSFNHNDVTTLLSGQDTDWSSSIMRSVEQLDAERILFFYDDAFIDKKVDTQHVEKMFNWAYDNDVSYFRLRAAPPPDQKVDEDIGIIHQGSLYRTSLFTSFVKKDVFLSMIRDGETAWAFEMAGIERSSPYDDFYSTYSTAFSYIHGVEKGIWYKSAIDKIEFLGGIVDKEKRAIMSAGDERKIWILSFKGKFLKLFPPAWRPKILNAARKFYKLMRRKGY